ncbi:LuxR C-terminal-related transcriptional regulator [Nocardia sp. alder85J]|uniref:LuxR C-terminal-related transcriptional regulator n=1 Tax=Nocardia sp. alder85J TaxID=2862949 RepID=UPI001CD65CBF|nr:LuxR C-terminal-related transcriptional regulator [Nocardia sp. alder85J]MCX4097038.1 LuxR C-terminal-related transcriptional regulator [Nocardia sp. alder85J]
MDVLRPRDIDALRAQLREAATTSGMPVVFGGSVRDGTLILSEFLGTRTGAMRGLMIPPDSGLGGSVVAGGRPSAVADYPAAATITHHYDAPVGAEGLRAVLAVPVVVDGRSRAVLYAACRDAGPIGASAAEAMMRAGRRLARELAIRDEVDRRLRLRESGAARDREPGRPDRPPWAAALGEELRDIHAEMRGIAQSVAEAGARDRLRDLADRLVRLVTGSGAVVAAPALSPRELDVLAHIALGCTNAEAAHRLSLRPETVKAYLRSAMVKLDAHTRHEAVVVARRLGLLP